MPYDVAQYQAEKAQGQRLPNGAKPLGKLTGKHLRIVNLHMAGLKGGEIAAALNLTPSRVSIILNDPLTQAEIGKRFVETDREMFARATKKIDESMDNSDPAIALRAAEMVWRSRGKFEKKEVDRPTAEDVVTRMLQLAGEQGQATLKVTVGAPPIEGSAPARDPLLMIGETEG